MKKILIVDDEIEIRKVLQAFLSKKGYDAVLCGGGEECLRKLKEGFLPDAIILDQRMPGMTGEETLEKIRKIEKKRIPVLVLTGSVNKNNIEIDADEFLMKPISLEAMLEKVSAIMN